MSFLARPAPDAIFFCAILLLSLPVSAKDHFEDAEIKFLGCHGELAYEGYEKKDILGGAYNAWCHDKSGQRVAKTRHNDIEIAQQVINRSNLRFTAAQVFSQEPFEMSL